MSHSTSDDCQTNRPRVWVFLLFGLLLLVGCVFIVGYWAKNKPTVKSRVIEKNLPYVETRPVTVADNRVTIHKGGFLKPQYVVDIKPQVSGKVAVVSPMLESGNTVSKGDVLLTIEDSDYAIAIERAKADVANARSNYIQEQSRSQQARLDAKRLNIKATSLALRKPQLEASKAKLASAQAQLTLAQINLSRTKIVAPFDALVQSSTISPGENIGPQNVIAKLISIQRYTAILTLNHQLFQLINLGDKVIIRDTLTGQERTAVINRFAPGFDSANRTIAAYVDIDNPLQGQPLLINSYVDAYITGKKIANSQWIANTALVDASFVWSKQADDTIKKVFIKLIYRSEKESLVVFMDPVDNYITRPKDGFFEGQRVTSERKLMNTKEQVLERAGAIKKAELLEKQSEKQSEIRAENSQKHSENNAVGKDISAK